MTRQARSARCLTIGLIVVLATSCAPRTSTRDAPIRTDRDQYLLLPGPYGGETTIVARFTAPKDTTVHILHCNGAISWGLQRLEGDGWIDAWAVATNGCFSPPIVVPGGGVHDDTLVVVSRADAMPRPGSIQETVPPGTYRVVWYNLLTSFDPEARPMGEELPLERRVSGPITIGGAPGL